MLNPCSESKKKRKRLEKQTLTLTTDDDDIKDEAKKNTKEEGIASNDGLLSNPLMVQSPQSVRSPAIFILDNAPLKKGLIGKKWKILNSEEHSQILIKQNKNVNYYRPEIVHKALLCILDSPLNKAGMVGAIYVKIDEGVLFEVKNFVRISRTFDRFCGVISLSYTSTKLVDIDKYVSLCSNELSPVFVVGAMVNGDVKRDYVQDYISVSEYPLTTKSCLGMICEALETKWKIW